MDAFAVSIGLGSKFSHKTISLAIIAGVYFSFFQRIKLLVDYLGGREVSG